MTRCPQPLRARKPHLVGARFIVPSSAQAYMFNEFPSRAAAPLRPSFPFLLFSAPSVPSALKKHIQPNRDLPIERHSIRKGHP
jgi:hypothetical protein